MLTSPIAGDRVPQDDAVRFEGTVTDAEEDPANIELRWESDLDGVFSTVPAGSDGAFAFDEARLTPGDHVITATATDSTGLVGIAPRFRDEELADHLAPTRPRGGGRGWSPARMGVRMGRSSGACRRMDTDRGRGHHGCSNARNRRTSASSFGMSCRAWAMKS